MFPGGHLLSILIFFPALGALALLFLRGDDQLWIRRLTFVVSTDGSISETKVVKGLAGGCSEEALRVIKLMPKWKPGKQNGRPVPVYFTIPVTFKLQ